MTTQQKEIQCLHPNKLVCAVWCASRAPNTHIIFHVVLSEKISLRSVWVEARMWEEVCVCVTAHGLCVVTGLKPKTCVLSWRAPSCRRDPCPDCGAMSALQPREPHVATTSRSLVQTSQPAADVLAERSFPACAWRRHRPWGFSVCRFFLVGVLQLNRLLSSGPGPMPLSVRGSCFIDVWSSDRVPKPCTTRRTLATPAQHSRGGVHHSGRGRKGSTSESTTAHGQWATHTAHRHTNVHRVHLVNGQPGQQPARRSTSLQRWRRRKTHASSCISLSVQSDGAVDISTAPPAFYTCRQHQGHVCQHLRPRKLRGNCAWPKSLSRRETMTTTTLTEDVPNNCESSGLVDESLGRHCEMTMRRLECKIHRKEMTNSGEVSAHWKHWAACPGKYRVYVEGVHARSWEDLPVPLSPQKKTSLCVWLNCSLKQTSIAPSQCCQKKNSEQNDEITS